MPKAKLHQSLRDLNDEIDMTQTDDEEKQAALDEMKTHVEKVQRAARSNRLCRSIQGAVWNRQPGSRFG